MGGAKTPWKPDKAIRSCELCSDVFSLLVRRHHCRWCGGIFCKRCASAELDFVPGYSRAQRVCVRCFRANSVETASIASRGEDRSSGAPIVHLTSHRSIQGSFYGSVDGGGGEEERQMSSSQLSYSGALNTSVVAMSEGMGSMVDAFGYPVSRQRDGAPSLRDTPVYSPSTPSPTAAPPFHLRGRDGKLTSSIGGLDMLSPAMMTSSANTPQGRRRFTAQETALSTLLASVSSPQRERCAVFVMTHAACSLTTVLDNSSPAAPPPGGSPPLYPRRTTRRSDPLSSNAPRGSAIPPTYSEEERGDEDGQAFRRTRHSAYGEKKKNRRNDQGLPPTVPDSGRSGGTDGRSRATLTIASSPSIQSCVTSPINPSVPSAGVNSVWNEGAASGIGQVDDPLTQNAAIPEEYSVHIQMLSALKNHFDRYLAINALRSDVAVLCFNLFDRASFALAQSVHDAISTFCGHDFLVAYVAVVLPPEPTATVPPIVRSASGDWSTGCPSRESSVLYTGANPRNSAKRSNKQKSSRKVNTRRKENSGSTDEFTEHSSSSDSVLSEENSSSAPGYFHRATRGRNSSSINDGGIPRYSNGKKPSATHRNGRTSSTATSSVRQTPNKNPTTSTPSVQEGTGSHAPNRNPSWNYENIRSAVSTSAPQLQSIRHAALSVAQARGAWYREIYPYQRNEANMQRGSVKALNVPPNPFNPHTNTSTAKEIVSSLLLEMLHVARTREFAKL